MNLFLRTSLVSAMLGAAVLGAAELPAAAVASGPPAVLNVGRISQQDVAAQPGSERDTLAEPDVAVSPLDSQIAVAVAHDGRFPDGGAVDISHAWTRDGGQTWQHAAVPYLTTAVGGSWPRVSDPVLAFGPDGTVYLSVLLFDEGCGSAVAVSRSMDGGATFGRPVLAHSSHSCSFSDDKNWLVVDNSPQSPHLGRIYQFWTAFLAGALGGGSPQELRWSDDRGQHWSHLVTVSGPHANSQNSQPMIQPNGTITDAYLNYGLNGSAEGPEAHEGDDAAARTHAPAVAPRGIHFVARTSHDGGATWSAETTISKDVSDGVANIRCCLASAVADPITGRLYAAFNSIRPSIVELTSSTDGRHWSAPVQVNRNPGPGYDHVNADVAAYAGRVFVTYGTRNTSAAGDRYVQQQISTSYDAGQTFGPPLSVGAVSDLKYAAQAGGIFPGDYIGTAAAAGRVYAVWCRSSRPPTATAKLHQTLYAAVLRP